jgi:hypothetical protein
MGQQLVTEMIDEALERLGGRGMGSSAELSDLLLDLRLAALAPEAELEELLAAEQAGARA